MPAGTRRPGIGHEPGLHPDDAAGGRKPVTMALALPAADNAAENPHILTRQGCSVTTKRGELLAAQTTEKVCRCITQTQSVAR